MVDEILVEVDLADVGAVSALEGVVWEDLAALVSEKMDVAGLKVGRVSRMLFQR